jgi:signal transduction histidine kinase
LESERLATMGLTTAKLVHEIGNPLNGMSTTVQLLERDLMKPGPPDKELLRATVHDLSSEINRLRSLLVEFRSLARAHALDLQPTALASLVTELLAVETVQYAERGIQIHNEVRPDLPLVMGDQEKLKQVVLNLCQNAVEAMPQGGCLTVRADRADRADGHVSLEVMDTGAGIPDGLDIFELFTTTKPSGMGLGLAVVRQIVLAHEGTITYTTEPGRGTVFRLSLPATPRARKRRPSAKSPPSPS